MAQPAAVQKLKHGKALCGKTFGKFVETFNWLVDFCLSIQGDADAANNANGTITVDRADPSAPIIRHTGRGAVNQPVGFGEKTFTYDGTDIAKILADDDIDIGQKSLAEGTGISLSTSQDGKTITISATGDGGGETSGYSTPQGGADLSVAAVRYYANSHQMQVKYHHDIYENGLLTSRTTDTEWSLMEGGQAVEETT